MTLRTEHSTRLIVPSQIDLGPDQEKWCAFAEMSHFGIPLSKVGEDNDMIEETTEQYARVQANQGRNGMTNLLCPRRCQD